MTEFLKEWETRTGTHSDLPSVMDRISQAESSGNVQAVMETQGVSERTARRQTKTTRDQQKADRCAIYAKRWYLPFFMGVVARGIEQIAKTGMSRRFERISRRNLRRWKRNFENIGIADLARVYP